MRVIAIINLKGGVGKTTTAVNMAAILAGAGKRVLLIDADPQANATQYLLPSEQDYNSLSAILEGLADDPYDFIYETGIPGLDIVPASIDLIDADIASVKSGSGFKFMDDFLQALREDGQADMIDAYDFAVIDCPPSFTAASVAAIYAATDVVIPVKIDAFSVRGMAQLLAQIKSVQRIQPRVKVAGVLVTMWHNTPSVTQGETILRESGVPMFETVIRRSDKVDEAGMMGQTLNEYSARSSAGKDYRAWVAEYLEVE